MRHLLILLTLLLVGSVCESQNIITRPQQKQKTSTSSKTSSKSSSSSKTSTTNKNVKKQSKSANQTTPPAKPVAKSTNSLGSTPNRTTTPSPSKSTHSKNLTKSVLYTFAPGEHICDREFELILKGNSKHFMLVSKNDYSNEYSLIIDGNRLSSVNNKKDIEYLCDFFYSVDGKLYYNYGNRYSSYAIMDGIKEGPYESIGNYYWGKSYSPSTYYFKRNGKYYRRDSDGKIYESNDKTKPYTSHSCKHRISFKDNYRYAIFDGQEFQLPIISNDKNYFYEEDFYISDNGTALFEIHCYDSENDNGKYKYFKISGNKLYEFSDEKDFDSELDSLKKKDSYDYFSFYNLKDSDNWERVKEIKSDYVLIYDFKDESGNHSFKSDWKEDFVVIDGKKIPCSAPFYGIYDKEKDAFVWVSQEGRELTMYVYKL